MTYICYILTCYIANVSIYDCKYPVLVGNLTTQCTQIVLLANKVWQFSEGNFLCKAQKSFMHSKQLTKLGAWYNYEFGIVLLYNDLHIYTT